MLRPVTLHRLLSSPRAAIDLASIMVGVIVIGIVGGIVAATVFAVIPWVQDEAAKQVLGSVRTSETAYRGLSAGEAYGELTDLTDKDPELLDKSEQDAVAVGLGADGTCYVAVSRSQSPSHPVFYIEDADPSADKYTGQAAACDGVDVQDVIDTLP